MGRIRVPIEPFPGNDRRLLTRYSAVSMAISVITALAYVAGIRIVSGKNLNLFDIVAITPARVGWTCIASGFVTFILVARRVFEINRADDRFTMGFCPYCGYDLRSTPGRCPECGKVVEKAI